MADEALPSGNGVAAIALGRLGHLLGESRYLDAAEATLRAGWAMASEYPHGHPSLLMALEEWLEPPEIVIVRADRDELQEWMKIARMVFAADRLVFGIAGDEPGLPGALATRRPEAAAVAYLCRGTSCSAPIHSRGELAAKLRRLPA
jgi:hypothetical protein